MGYEIVERGYTCPFGTADIVAWDCGTLVFIDVSVSVLGDDSFPDDYPTPAKRARAELVAGSYLAGSDDVDHAVRFDSISVLVVTPDRAFVRHHRDVLNGAI